MCLLIQWLIQYIIKQRWAGCQGRAGSQLEWCVRLRELCLEFCHTIRRWNLIWCVLWTRVSPGLLVPVCPLCSLSLSLSLPPFIYSWRVEPNPIWVRAREPISGALGHSRGQNSWSLLEKNSPKRSLASQYCDCTFLSSCTVSLHCSRTPPPYQLLLCLPHQGLEGQRALFDGDFFPMRILSM